MVDFYQFLKGFMLTYPEFKKRPIFLVGEGYAGHLVPLIARTIEISKNQDFNLKGIAIGNGWVDPFYQFPAHESFAVQNELINPARGFILSMGYELCQYMMLSEIPFLS